MELSKRILVVVNRVLVVAGFGIAASVLTAGGLGVGILGFLGWSDQLAIYQVLLTPQGGSGTLGVVREKGKSCDSGRNPHGGCMMFEEDKIGLIQFYLPGSKKKIKSCDNANRVITKIALTTHGEGGGSDQTKGNFAGPFPLDGWLKNNAFPDVDLNTGIVYQAASLDDAKTQVWLTNWNSHDFDGGEKQFWYQVTVSDCEKTGSTFKTWVTDPRVDNQGTKY